MMPFAAIRPPSPVPDQVAVRAPAFGLSTTPVADIASELRLQLEHELVALVYRTPR